MPPPSYLRRKKVSACFNRFLHPFHCEFCVRLVQFNPDAAAFEAEAGDGGGAAAQEGVEHQVAFVGRGQQATLDQRHGLLRGMFAEGFFVAARRGNGPDGLKPGGDVSGRDAFPRVPVFGVGRGGTRSTQIAPDGFHLFAGDGLHGGVVEGVPALLVFGGPEEGFGAVGEVAAGKVGRRVGFFPGDVVEQLEAELLQGVADGEDDVQRAGDPEGTVGLEHALAAAQPFEVERVVQLRPAALVPVALVHFDHPPGVAGDAAVGQEVGRVGEDGVEAAFGILGSDGVEQLEAVAVVKADERVVAPVDEPGRGGGGCGSAGRGGWNRGRRHGGGHGLDFAVLAQHKRGGRNRPGMGPRVIRGGDRGALAGRAGWAALVKRARAGGVPDFFGTPGSIDQIGGSDQGRCGCGVWLGERTGRRGFERGDFTRRTGAPVPDRVSRRGPAWAGDPGGGRTSRGPAPRACRPGSRRAGLVLARGPAGRW